jgi:outer membrane cobalamin receptor
VEVEQRSGAFDPGPRQAKRRRDLSRGGGLHVPTRHAAAVLALALAALSPTRGLAADVAPVDPDELTMQELDASLARETSVATSRMRRIRETPGVVTILTRDELLASGARDLADVLERVPGFQLGVDVSNDVGAGFRGIWGQEGKILYLVDGIELNDLSYGGFPLGGHVPIDQLDRIEIVRGPGSALYGGHAELAVVNVVTRAAHLDGAGASATAGRVARATSSAGLTAAAGTTAGGVQLGATAAIATGVRSDATYTDHAGSQVDLADASRVTPGLVTARLTWKALDVRALYDDFRVIAGDGYDAVAPRNVPVRWRTAAVDARAALELGESLTLTPQVTYRWEQPWQAKVPDLETFYYDVTNQRVTGRLAATYDSVTGGTITAGAEAYLEQGRVNDFANGLLSYQGAPRVESTNVAGFLEVAADTDWANLLAGARVEHHSDAGTAFVPRLALTRVLDPVHVKLLASGAFRAPSIENVNYADGQLRPERTWAFEAEVGWQLSDAVYVVANVFDVTVLRPIVFSFDGGDVYSNEGKTGSRGVEAELHLRRGPASALVSYSFYSARGKNDVAAYAVAGDGARLVGFAGHKLVASARLQPLRRTFVSPAVTVLSSRAAYDGTEAPGAPAAGRVGARVYLDLFVGVQDLGAKGVELAVGLRDALDQRAVYVQPYPGGHAPLPGTGREVWLRLRWDRG